MACVFELGVRFGFGFTGDRVDIVPGQCDIELLPCDQFAVANVRFIECIGLHRNDGVGRQPIDLPKLPGAGTPSPAAHGALPPPRGASAKNLFPWLSIRPIHLVDSNVSAPHDAGGLIEGDVQLIRHQLAEACPRTLPRICLPDVECGRVVLMNHNP